METKSNSKQVWAHVKFAEGEFCLQHDGSDIWISDQGVFLTSSSSLVTHPSLKIQMEIITLQQLDLSTYVDTCSMKEVARFAKEKVIFADKQQNDIDCYNNNKEEDCSCVLALPLQEDIQANTGETDFYCGICREVLTKKVILDEPESSQITETDYICKRCKETERQYVLEDKHKPKSEEEDITCDTCYKIFATSGELKQHILSHFISNDMPKLNRNNERRFTCHMCHKHFSQKSNLDRHILAHSGERPFACDVCDKKFTQKFTLKTHKLIHDGKKEFICEICGKGFIRRDYLKKHTFTHSDEKPFYCIQCDKQFAQKHHLKSHESTHQLTTDE